MNTELASRDVTLAFPVVLSRKARREAFVASGRQADRAQVLEIDHEALIKLEREVREKVVDVWERISLGPEVDADDIPLEPAVGRYDSLHRSQGKWILSQESSKALVLDEVFFATPGRTVHALDYLSRELDDTEPLDEMLSEAPLIGSLKGANLTLEAVLKAYEEAFELAKRIKQLSRQGRHSEGNLTIVSESFLFMRPRRDGGLPVGLLHDSDPRAFEEAKKLFTAVSRTAGNSGLVRFSGDVCQATLGLATEIETDSDLVRLAMRSQAEEFTRAWEARETYERERAHWIAERGSERLRLAAEREYKHDGIYRDERLAEDFPEFVGSLGKRIEVREVVNPTAEAVELESEALERVAALDLKDVQVRIVWLTSSDFEVKNGEYIQLTGYLGRHTVHRPVQETEDDIPF